MLLNGHNMLILKKNDLSQNPRGRPSGLNYGQFSSFWVISHLLFVVAFSLLAFCYRVIQGSFLKKNDLSRKSKMATFRAELWLIFIILGNISFVIRGIILVVSMLLKSHTRVIFDTIDLFRNPRWLPSGLSMADFQHFWQYLLCYPWHHFDFWHAFKSCKRVLCEHLTFPKIQDGRYQCWIMPYWFPWPLPYFWLYRVKVHKGLSAC